MANAKAKGTPKAKADADDCSDLAESKLAGEMAVRSSILEARKHEHEHKRMKQKRRLRMAEDEGQEAKDKEAKEEDAEEEGEEEEEA